MVVVLGEVSLGAVTRRSSPSLSSSVTVTSHSGDTVTQPHTLPPLVQQDLPLILLFVFLNHLQITGPFLACFLPVIGMHIRNLFTFPLMKSCCCYYIS